MNLSYVSIAPLSHLRTDSWQTDRIALAITAVSNASNVDAL